MGASDKKPNHRLRQQRLQRSWTLEQAADELYRIGGRRERGDINAKMIGRWERGEYPPSLFWQEKLCLLYSKSAEELGFMEPPHIPERLPAVVSSSMQHVSPVLSLPSHRTIDLLCETLDDSIEQQLGAWLAVSADDLAPLFGCGWSLEDVLTSLQVVLQGVQAMSRFSRRKLLQLGAAAVVSSVPLPEEKHISVEDRIHLHRALSESIAAGWKLFHTAGNAQVLAVGHAQLHLVQHVSSELYPSVRPLMYTGVYNLIGAALHFQGRYDEAYQAHERAYLAALEGADVLNMAQSRTCQANGLREQHRYSEALQTMEAALRLVSQQQDTDCIRLRAHVLAAAAESAAFLGETNIVQKNLAASEGLLEQLPFTAIEEFDHASWHQYAGTCALILKHHARAAEELQRAVESLSPHWLVRQATALMPLAIAYARARERDRCLETLEKAAQVIRTMNASGLTRQFVVYLDEEIQTAFPAEPQISAFIATARQQPLTMHTFDRLH
jgi:tetratricopeptide (TPR) repeat protein